MTTPYRAAPSAVERNILYARKSVLSNTYVSHTPSESNLASPAPKNVLTEKKGRLLGVLAEHQVGCWRRKIILLCIFHVLVVFCVYKLLAFKIFLRIRGSKKIVLEATIEIWFWAASGNTEA